ncbi:MAG: HAMP domain-containing protein [Planctomycetes bacterium]|nr:HAMP domain-containing protein [Planctomycetota bacterium]
MMTRGNTTGPSRLGVKLTLSLACALSAILAAFSYGVITLWERSHIDAAVSETERFSDTIKRSAQYSMLHAQTTAVHEIINAVGKQKDVEWVRLFNKEGRITYSTIGAEIDTVLDKRTEACYRCHTAQEPLQKLASSDRSRILESRDGHRVLATIDPIYNAPACSSASCHIHPETQQVLGVLDVAVSLATTDAIIRRRTYTIAGFGFGGIVVVCFLVALFLHNAVTTPVRRLLMATRKISGGDFDTVIPTRGNDEIAHLAASFNGMTQSLRLADTRLHDLNASLERRVDEKTRELKTAQMQIVRAEKLASVGRMAAGVAHELNNPLTGVLTFAHLLARKMPKESQDFADLQVIINETNRCSKIIKDLLQFSREAQSDRKPERINNVIRQTLPLLEHQAEFQNIQIRLELDEALPPIVIDAAQIKQVLMNIIQNAAQAMPNGGALTIATSARAGSVAVRISDTGCGIPPENLEKIFDPFFTTKDPGKGTGLGLAVSLRLAENHGGTIDVASEVGKGSTFTIVLPLDGQDPRKE